MQSLHLLTNNRAALLPPDPLLSVSHEIDLYLAIFLYKTFLYIFIYLSFLHLYLKKELFLIISLIKGFILEHDTKKLLCIHSLLIVLKGEI